MLGFPFSYFHQRRFTQIYDYALISQMGEKYHGMENGGKMVLPSSAVAVKLQNFPAPLLFKVTNITNLRSTHVGILEFSAEENSCYIPDWIGRALNLDDGNKVKVEQVSLPIAKLIKFQPIGHEFMAVRNPTVLLNLELNRFSCLTKGDIISIHFNHNNYQLRVVDTNPAQAVTIILNRLKIEFIPPDDIYEGSVEDKNIGKQTSDTSMSHSHGDSNAFDHPGFSRYIQENPYLTSGIRGSPVACSFFALHPISLHRSYPQCSANNMIEVNDFSEIDDVD